MSGPSTKKRLVLDRQHLISIVSDPLFYAECPAFAWMRDTALHTVRLYNESKERNCCGGDWSILRPTVDGWYTALKNLATTDRPALEQVRDYLARKKGYLPQPIVIFYRASKEGRPHKFQF